MGFRMHSLPAHRRSTAIQSSKRVSHLPENPWTGIYVPRGLPRGCSRSCGKAACAGARQSITSRAYQESPLLRGHSMGQKPLETKGASTEGIRATIRSTDQTRNRKRRTRQWGTIWSNFIWAFPYICNTNSSTVFRLAPTATRHHRTPTTKPTGHRLVSCAHA